jgi:hypothetical protein
LSDLPRMVWRREPTAAELRVQAIERVLLCGPIYRLITRELPEDRMVVATRLLESRLREAIRAQQPS